MATEQTRKLSDLSKEELEERAREGLLAGEILEQQQQRETERETARGVGEFTPRMPSAMEGGGRPVEIHPKTAETITHAPEGIDPALKRALEEAGGEKARLERLLHVLNSDEQGFDPHAMNEEVVGGDKKLE